MENIFLLIQVVWAQGNLRLFDLKRVALTKYLNVPVGLEKVTAALQHDRDVHGSSGFVCQHGCLLLPEMPAKGNKHRSARMRKAGPD